MTYYILFLFIFSAKVNRCNCSEKNYHQCRICIVYDFFVYTSHMYVRHPYPMYIDFGLNVRKNQLKAIKLNYMRK